MIHHGDSLDVLKTIPDESVDLLLTDPPYGISFMSRGWDKALPDIGIFKECFRVLKPGAFAFVMSAPRSDVCSRMAILLEDAGFNIAFTPIYWTYASGFPKAMNIGKMVDKRNGRDQDTYKPFAEYLKVSRLAKGYSMARMDEMLGTNTAYSWWEGRASGVQIPRKEYYIRLKEILDLDDRFDELIEREEAEREVLASKSKLSAYSDQGYSSGVGEYGQTNVDITAPATPEAKALDGSYGGFQPKPAVEVVIVAMKPLSEKTYVDQALKNGKGITWLDDCRVPSEPYTINTFDSGAKPFGSAVGEDFTGRTQQGRFPANLLVSDDVLNDHSRFFSLDEWADTLPFLAVPKASKREKNEGLDGFEEKEVRGGGGRVDDGYDLEDLEQKRLRDAATAYGAVKAKQKNSHPTVKPLKLMSYLITLGSRPGDTVLDPFLGSGTTAVAAKQLGRECIGIEREKEYVEIAEARLNAVPDALI